MNTQWIDVQHYYVQVELSAYGTARPWVVLLSYSTYSTSTVPAPRKGF